MKIEIIENSCILCGKCVKVCPSEIFHQEPKGIPTISNIEFCIKCGHCVAICPSQAVNHEVFPPEKIHPIDRSLMPTSEQLQMLLLARRSHRNFTNAAIPEPFLSQIIDAANRAPTSSNSQKVYFKLITDPEQLKSISDFTINGFKKMVKILTFPIVKPFIKWFFPDIAKYIPSFKEMELDYLAGKDMILRGATAVLLIYTPKNHLFGAADANLAYQNGSLMAESLGVGNFYTGFVIKALDRDSNGKFAKSLGIKGKIHAGLAMGMPQFKYPNYVDRKEVRG